VVGGFDPDEGFWIFIVSGNECCDGVFKGFEASVCPSFYLLISQFSKPPFDQVQPRRTGGSEMKVEARALNQPVSDKRGLVCAVIIQDKVDGKFFRYVAVYFHKELPKFLTAMSRVAAPQKFPAQSIQGREQSRCPITLVIIGSSFGLAGTHGQEWLSSVKCLNLALFVDAKDHRLMLTHYCPK